MYITSPDPQTRHLEVYDFFFQNGQVFTISLDKECGDTVDWTTTPMAVLFHQQAHPQTTSPDTAVPAEDHTIFLTHVLRIVKHEEDVMPLTTEQQLSLQATVQELTKGSRYKM